MVRLGLWSASELFFNQGQQTACAACCSATTLEEDKWVIDGYRKSQMVTIVGLVLPSVKGEKKQ